MFKLGTDDSALMHNVINIMEVVNINLEQSTLGILKTNFSSFPGNRNELGNPQFITMSFKSPSLHIYLCDNDNWIP